MMGYFAIILVPIAALLINILAQIGICRWSAIRFVKSVIYGFLVGAAALIILHALVVPAAVNGNVGEVIFYLIGNGAIYIAEGYLYFQVVNLGEASIRFRLLRELRRYPEGAPQTVIDAQYSDQLILRTRVMRLTNNGQIRLENGVYHLQAGTLLLISGILTGLRRFLLRKDSEFDA